MSYCRLVTYHRLDIRGIDTNQRLLQLVNFGGLFSGSESFCLFDFIVTETSEFHPGGHGDSSILEKFQGGGMVINRRLERLARLDGEVEVAVLIISQTCFE